ncbi:hypothetical protein [Shigella sp. FC2833]|uniref:hypothetical protein n=1 Tax=Enterobacteriaceae TaxID=543 RepID=UPI000B2B6A24|nr:hypothetical protein [Shigella sp. FC2833]
MKKIAILLPGPRREPVGGYKVLYQYGNYLASVGWQIDFIYLTNRIVCYNRFSGLVGKIKAKLFSLLKFYKWFDFTSSNINHYVIKSLKKEISKILILSFAPLLRRLYTPIRHVELTIKN